MPDENPNWIADEDDRVRAYRPEITGKSSS